MNMYMWNLKANNRDTNSLTQQYLIHSVNFFANFQKQNIPEMTNQKYNQFLSLAQQEHVRKNNGNASKNAENDHFQQSCMKESHC